MATKKEIEDIIIFPYQEIWGATPPSFESLCYRYFDMTPATILKKCFETVAKGSGGRNPQFRDFNEAVTEHQKNSGTGMGKGDEFMRQLHSKPHRAHRMRADYITRWLESKQSEECRKLGTYAKALAYISEVAWVQAQVLCDAQNISYDAMNLGYNTQNADEIRDSVSEAMRLARVEGRIEVALPSRFLKYPHQIPTETPQTEVISPLPTTTLAEAVNNA